MGFPVWLKGVFAAFIGGAANIFAVVITDPVAFNFGAEWRKTLVAAIAGGALAVAAYLKKSPFPENNTVVNQS
jgi:hypothetical protein